MLQQFKVRGARVLVRQLSAVTATASGLILTTTQTEEMHFRGIVERVGPGELLESGTRRPVQDVAEGDLVYFAKFAGAAITLDGHRRLLLMEDELQGSVEAAAFSIVEHRDEDAEGGADHLDGEPCAICMGSRARQNAALETPPTVEDDAARGRLEQMREALRAGR